jgi:hypothetical protein
MIPNCRDLEDRFQIKLLSVGHGPTELLSDVGNEKLDVLKLTRFSLKEKS